MLSAVLAQYLPRAQIQPSLACGALYRYWHLQPYSQSSFHGAPHVTGNRGWKVCLLCRAFWVRSPTGVKICIIQILTQILINLRLTIPYRLASFGPKRRRKLGAQMYFCLPCNGVLTRSEFDCIQVLISFGKYGRGSIQNSSQFLKNTLIQFSEASSSARPVIHFGPRTDYEYLQSRLCWV